MVQVSFKMGNWRGDCESVFNVNQMIFLDMTDFHRLEQSNKKSSPESEETESQDWICRYCDQTFESTDILKWHLYTSHNIEGMCSLWKYIGPCWLERFCHIRKKRINTFVTKVWIIYVVIAGTKILLTHHYTWRTFGLRLFVIKRPYTDIHMEQKSGHV